jgi:hypothetical protein
MAADPYDKAYWDRLHIEADKRPAVPLPPTIKRSVKVFSEASVQRKQA